MITNTCFFLFISHLFIIFELIHFGEAVGGIAEMKALTGDAPYLGTGNQEQAPEYFGEAAMRQYDSNPAYSYYNNGYYGPSRYFRNYYRTLPYRNYGGVSGPMGGGGGCPNPCS